MSEKKGPVLVVDDEADIVDFLTTVLRDEGYATDSARDGLEALGKIEAGAPALVILDLMMPKMNGFEVLDAMRARNGGRRPSILVLSAKSTHQDILDALERGADDFIPKPFDLEDLLLRIRVWLDRKQTTQSPAGTLRIFTLGPFRVFLGTDVVLDEELGDARARTLLKYLIAEWDQPVQRSEILYVLWPDLDEDDAEKQLRSLLVSTKRMLGESSGHQPYIVESSGTICFNVDSDAWVDMHEFETQVRTAQDAQETGDVDLALGLFLSALALYKEDFLRENLYEDWPSERRERLRELWISSMFRVAAICADRCEFADSVRLMKKVLEIDPYRENAYQALMLYLSRAGRRGEAIQLYRYAEKLFAQHLAAQPAPSTRMLFEKILRGEAG
ncbi:MAG TPA: response regulator [Chloroflexota bacterium]|nr:response regulator [Chloroflexota bacterium]